MKIKNAIGAFASLALAASTFGAGLLSPFESLPEETILAVRFDNSSEMLDQYVDSTKIGKLLLSDEKIADYKDFIQKMIDASDEKGSNFIQKLGEVGLELEDIYAMLSSHFGVAVVMQNVEGRKPMPTILAWAEMDEGLAESAFTAVLEAAAENEDLERIDEEIAGAQGARIRTKSTGSSALVARLQDRFFYAIGQVSEPISTIEEAAVYEVAELDALGSFISSQQGEGGGFLSSFYGDPGVSSVRPAYPSRLEMLGDVKQALSLFPIKNRQMLDALGIDEFTKFAAWSGLVDMEERSTLFIGAPAPRAGIASLIDFESFDFAPPAWVPSSVNSYSAFSFDMSSLYDALVSIAKKTAPAEQVDQQIEASNQQLQMMLQTDIPTLMSSFGKRIHVLEYPIEMTKVSDAEDAAEMPRAPQAVVMDFARPEILQAGVSMISSLAGPSNPNMQVIEEQGFNGVRILNPAMEVTAAHGLGKLVLAVGSDTTSTRIFSALSNPPEGQAALVNDESLRSFLSEAQPQPSIGFSYARGEKMLKNLVPIFEYAAQSVRQSGDEKAAELLSEALKLLPSEEELGDVMGAVFTNFYATDAGLVFEGVNQYK